MTGSSIPIRNAAALVIRGAIEGTACVAGKLRALKLAL